MSEEGNETQQGKEREESSTLRIYVASLSDYNAGRLHGRWIDAARDIDGLQADVQAMLDASPEPIAEEWAIHDYEGFEGVDLSEYEDLRVVSMLALGIKEHGPAFAAWARICGLEAEQLARFADCYLGTWESVGQYAEEFLDGVGARHQLEQIEEWLQPYVALDVAGFARDLQLGGDISTVEDSSGVHIFDERA